MFCTTNYQNSNEKIAIILWLYNTHLWPEFFSLLKPLSNRIKLYIGLCNDNDHQNQKILSDLNYFDHSTYFQDNFGCDVAPFLNQLQTVSEQVFIKVHGKMSSWGVKNNVSWRSVLLNDLIGSIEIFDQNYNTILDSNIGMVCNKQLLLNDREGRNSDIIKKISRIINMDYEHNKASYFPAGNMFLSKTSIYKKYFTKKNCNKLLHYLNKEKGKIDDQINGTYSHSLERIFGYIIKNENKKFAHPNHKIIKIINDQAENGYYSMVITYDNKCYLEEDLNAYGEILEQNNSNLLIKWMHMPIIINQKYDILDNHHIQKSK